jgi:hypothetical protein
MRIRLTKKQREFMDQLEANQADPDLWGDRKGIELFHCCGKWKTAWALQNKDLIEVLKNENRQYYAFLTENGINK